MDQLTSVAGLLVDGETHAETKLSVVLKERVRPSDAAAILVEGVGGGGQVAAVDGGAAGGVGDDRAISEELRKQLDIRSFAAAGAGAGELEERFEQLYVLDLGERKLVARNLRKAEEEFPVVGFALAQLRLGRHVDGLVLGCALGLGRAGFDAESASGAIFRCNLQGVLEGGEVLPLGRGGLEGSRCRGKQIAGIDLGANDSVRAD